jgi:hypothetical protein
MRFTWVMTDIECVTFVSNSATEKIFKDFCRTSLVDLAFLATNLEIKMHWHL